MDKIAAIKQKLTSELKKVKQAGGKAFTHSKLATIAKTLTFKDQKLTLKDVEAIVEGLDAKVVEHLATDLP